MAQKELGASGGSTSEQEEISIVAVGDALCGRSSLITTYTTGVFPEYWTPTVINSTTANTVFKGQQFQLNIRDVAADEDYDRLRSLCYPGADVVLICYDVMSPPSFNNVFHKWYPEVQRFCPGVPIILVGCKTDLRSDKLLEEKLWSLGQNAVMFTQGQEARRKINAVAYLECSAKCNENVDDVFREATKQALTVKRVKDRIMAQKGLGVSGGSTSEQEEFTVVVVVGDGLSGKTALIRTYTTGVFPECCAPTVFDCAVANTVFKGQQFQQNIWDTGGTEDFDRLRSLCYPGADVVLIYYDVMSPDSFDNVFHKWYPEVQRSCPGVPIILVACKTDLRSDKLLEEKLWSLGQNAVMFTQGQEARRKINAVAYLECSAKCNKNVDDVFREATKQALMVKRVKDSVRESGSQCLLS